MKKHKTEAGPAARQNIFLGLNAEWLDDMIRRDIRQASPDVDVNGTDIFAGPVSYRFNDATGQLVRTQVEITGDYSDQVVAQGVRSKAAFLFRDVPAVLYAVVMRDGSRVRGYVTMPVEA